MQQGTHIKGKSMRIRNEHSVRSRWWLPKYKFMTALYYALQYSEWRNEYKTISDTSKAIRYDLDKVQTSGDDDPTERVGMRRAELRRKMDVIEEVAKAAGAELADWLLIGVTQEGASYKYLRNNLKMPCGENKYYDMRSRFYFELSKKIEKIGSTGDKKT